VEPAVRCRLPGYWFLLANIGILFFRVQGMRYQKLFCRFMASPLVNRRCSPFWARWVSFWRRVGLILCSWFSSINRQATPNPVSSMKECPWSLLLILYKLRKKGCNDAGVQRFNYQPVIDSWPGPYHGLEGMLLPIKTSDVHSFY